MRPSIRPDAVLVQAVIAGALSFAHLHDIAEAAGQHGWKAWAYPISVDLLLVAAWRRLRTLRATDGPVRSAWIWFAVALVASLGANVATAGLLDLHQVPAWLRILVAGWPALAFLGGTFLAHNPAPPAEPRTPVPAECDPDPEPTIDREPVQEAVTAAESAPALPPAPAPVAPPLLAHARKVAAAHLTATGTPIDLDTLTARLGVPTPLAESIAAQLT